MMCARLPKGSSSLFLTLTARTVGISASREIVSGSMFTTTRLGMLYAMTGRSLTRAIASRK